MKTLASDQLTQLSGQRLRHGERFRFRCHPDIGCFNRCCRNLNLFLYPYDVIRLKHCLGISSDRFIDHYVDVVLREGRHFPDVLLRMADDQEQTCPFLTDTGCRVYSDRPDTCRTFPIEHGLSFGKSGDPPQRVSFFRPPEFCQGPMEPQEWTLETWAEDQDAVQHNRMTRRWATLQAMFTSDPWQGQGPNGPKGRMAFMATYNIDAFRDFVFTSSFLKRYKVKKDRLARLRQDDTALLNFGMDWIKLFLWGLPSRKLRPRR